MQRVLTTKEIWTEAKRLAEKAPVRKLAIAYVTKDHIGLREGDVLVVDASVGSIQSGQTDAKLLAGLHKKKVAIHSHKDLHSKVMLLGGHAIVGSANMSGSRLTEAAVLTDAPTVRSGVASFVAQLATKRSLLDESAIAKLCKIEVVRKGWSNTKDRPRTPVRPLGNATWIVGVHDLARDPSVDEQNLIDRATRKINENLGATAEEYTWMRWSKKAKFAKECREGDIVIQIDNNNGTKGRIVTRRRAVLLKRNEPKWVRIYLSDVENDSDEINWSTFQRVLRGAGYLRKVRPFSVQRLEPDMADDIDLQWTKAV
ncbi:hypothetical protein ACQR1Y_23605 [Bradyrhizobium sp. HKCCYLRH3099]|uniref:hypothetical protein n=1 Tax=unclassified Bradyrhizobium TaxID=2631580 RepID=UPI003EBBDD90